MTTASPTTLPEKRRREVTFSCSSHVRDLGHRSKVTLTDVGSNFFFLLSTFLFFSFFLTERVHGNYILLLCYRRAWLKSTESHAPTKLRHPLHSPFCLWCFFTSSVRSCDLGRVCCFERAPHPRLNIPFTRADPSFVFSVVSLG